MVLTGTSNQAVFEKFAGKKLHRINNMFVTEDGMDGFLTSNIVFETLANKQITIHTNNSIYVFSLVDEPTEKRSQTLFSLGNPIAASV